MKRYYLIPYREGKVIPILYEGKTSEIPEELAKELVDTIPHIFYGMRITDTSGNNVLFKNYKINKFVKRSGKRSIQSACNQEFCIIYKTN
jgi:hypothetical protein